MVQILVKFKWTYVSVLYVAGARESVYMFKQKMWLQRKESNIKLCTALECELTNDDKAAEYAEVIVKLKEQGARVIVAFLGGTTTDTLLHALERNNSASDFIFIGTEGFQPTLAKKTKSRLPLRAFIFYGRNGDPEFKEYYDGLDPFRSATRGAWEGEYEPEALNCTRGNGTLVSTSDYTSDCPYRTFRDLPNYTLYNGIGKVTSIVKTYARALHRLIQAKCPGAKDDKTLLDNCILGPELFEYITNTSFITSNGTRVDYDKNGDVLGDYSATYTWALDEKYEKRLRKLAETKRILVRISDKGKIYSEADAVTWNQGTKNLSIDWELMPWSDIEVPESVCSEPCKPGFCTVIKEPDCCWKCKPCQVNEYVDGSNCISCEPNYWPNRNFTNCTQIDTTNMMKNAIGIVAMLIICAMFGLIKVTVLLWLFVRHWERKAIKGCTRELMVPIMVGLTMAYLTVFAFIYPPNDVICYFSYIGFNMSLCLLFGPLFLKTKRVHMIFQASDKCKQRVQNADSTSMIIGIVVIITIQVSLMVTTMVVATHVDGCAIRELPHMAMWNVKESESRCHLEPWVLLVPLCYNILLLLLCAVYGFLTRKLPENYNESWYIFIAVITTIFVWIACIPSYFVVKEAKYQVFLLSLALVVNAVVISICLFVPKIYVVYTIKDRDLRVSRMGSRRLSIGIDEVEPINSSRSRSFHRSKSSHSTNNSN